MDKNEFIERQLAFQKDLTALLTEKESLTKDYVRIRKEVEFHKKRIELEPELKGFLERFQRKEQEKLVGMNQKLLTAILQDVMQTDGEERKVVMDIFTERGLPALSILIEKNEQGVLEDVYDGAGGAIANILSFGLRVIALLQSKKRKFLVLDEPDCWIKPELIPDFVDVIKQLSEKLGIQILIISHHNEDLLKGLKHRLILEKNDGKLQTRWSVHGDCEPAQWEDQEGIRSIYLENFQSHSSTYLPLSPTVTLLTGLNDLGKSTVVNALRAVFYGNGNDTNIKHFENQARVVVDFGDSNLIWERKLKGKPKESYTLINEVNGLENPLHRSDSAKGAPEWLEEETGIGLIEGFDIQLGHQKRPVFILDEAPSKKAKALSIGDESNYVQVMLNLAKEDLTTARRQVKLGEQELERIYRRLRLFDQFGETLTYLESEEVKNQFKNTLSLIEKQSDLEKIRDKYYTASQKCSALSNAPELNDSFKDLLTNVEISPISIKQLQKQIKNYQILSIELPKIKIALPETPSIDLSKFNLPKRCQFLALAFEELKRVKDNLLVSIENFDIKAINKQIEELRKLNLKKLSLLAFENKEISLPELNEKQLKETKERLTKIEKNLNSIQEIDKNYKDNLQLLTDTAQELEEFVGSMKVCPLCQQSIAHKH